MTKYQSIVRVNKECIDYALRYAKYIERQRPVKLDVGLSNHQILEKLIGNSDNEEAK